MRLALFLCTAALLPAGQQESATYTYDVNGNRVETTARSVARSADGVTTTQKVQSLNGRQVPSESTEERVIEQSGGSRVVERIVQRYDQDGRPTRADKVIVEEQASSDGTVTTTTSLYRTDLNGNRQLAEKTTREAHQDGAQSTTTTVVERPGLDGSLTVAEKRSQTDQASASGKQSETVVYAPDGNGGFYAAKREIKEQTTTGNVVKETSTVYESSGAGATSMRLTAQVDTTVRQNADGSQVRESNIYSAPGPGRHSDGPLQLRAQETVERKAASDGTVVETVSVRKASMSDAGRLGAAEKVSETVCKGNCGKP